MAAQRGQVAQPRRREHVVDGAVLDQRRHQRRLPFLGDGQWRDRDAGSHLDIVAGHGRTHRIARGRIAIATGPAFSVSSRIFGRLRYVATQASVRLSMPRRPASVRSFSSALRTFSVRPLAASFSSVSNCTCAAILDGVAALAKFVGFRLGTVNHGLRDARQRPHDRLGVEAAGNHRLAHAAQPRRGRFGADVAVLVPPQEAAGKIVRIPTAAAEPLHEEGRCLSAVEVRKRHPQQFVLLDAAIEVCDERRHALAAANRLPELRAGIRDQRFPAMAQFLVNEYAAMH